MATIYDVAKRAGVSPKTVSRVLNKDAPVSERTRRAVAEAIASLGYVPSFAARSIKSQKSGLIGLITGAISTTQERPDHAGLPDLLIVQGIQSVVAQSCKTLLISDSGGDQDRTAHLIRTFREHRVEGLIFVADAHKKVDLPLPVEGTTAVLVNCYDSHGTPAVVPDDEAGQHALTRHVIEAGHRRIAYLTLAPSLVATRLRRKGYRAALEKAGIAYDPALVAPGEGVGGANEHALAFAALEHFMRGDDPPTVVCCGNDRLAMVVYGILRDRGLVIPEQMSVAGYDDHKIISEALYPALTTAQLPYRAMGERAAELLVGLIEDPQLRPARKPIRMRGEVRIRGSVTQARSDAANIIELKGRLRQ